MDFDSGSIKVNVDGEEDNSSRITVSGGSGSKAGWVYGNNKTFSCDLTGINGGQTITITYKTKLNDGEIQDIWSGAKSSLSYENIVKAKKADEDISNVQGNGSSTLNVTKDNWSNGVMMTKDGTAIAPENIGDKWKIKWNVTVKTASRNFKTLTLIDTMGKGLDLDTTSIEVLGDNDSDITSSVTTTPVTLGDGKTQMTMELVKNSTPATGENVYKITYETEVKEEYFDQTGDLSDNDIKKFCKT